MGVFPFRGRHYISFGGKIMRPIHVICVGSPGVRTRSPMKQCQGSKPRTSYGVPDRHTQLVSAEKCRSLVPFREAINAMRAAGCPGKRLSSLCPAIQVCIASLACCRKPSVLHKARSITASAPYSLSVPAISRNGRIPASSPPTEGLCLHPYCVIMCRQTEGRSFFRT